MQATNTATSSVNWIGLKTLYLKEVSRFLKVYNQTLVAPMVTSLLFLAVFSLAIGRRVDAVHGVPFQEFMAAGLIMMTMVQNSFANSSSTITMGKVLGTIIDYLIPPLNAGEVTFALAAAGVTRGIATGVMVGIAVMFFVPIGVHDPVLLVFYAVMSCLMLSLCGIVAGLYAESFDQMHAITSYIITPLAFLSGTFYSIKNLPPFWQEVSVFNPFFYMIDGFRYSLTGYTDTTAFKGVAMLITFNIILYIACYVMLRKGYRIKS